LAGATCTCMKLPCALTLLIRIVVPVLGTMTFASGVVGSQ
jgi:hypothetical protein